MRRSTRYRRRHTAVYVCTYLCSTLVYATRNRTRQTPARGQVLRRRHADPDYLARTGLSGLYQSGPIVATTCHYTTCTQYRRRHTAVYVCAHTSVCCVLRANQDTWDPPIRSTYTCDIANVTGQVVLEGCVPSACDWDTRACTHRVLRTCTHVPIHTHVYAMQHVRGRVHVLPRVCLHLARIGTPYLGSDKRCMSSYQAMLLRDEWPWPASPGTSLCIRRHGRTPVLCTRHHPLDLLVS